MRIEIIISLFVCAVSAQAVTGPVWLSERGISSTGVTPASGLVTEFWDIPEGTDLAAVGDGDKNWQQNLPASALKRGDRKNIIWCATIPNWGNNAPVVIGEKVFLLYEEGWKADAPMLLCLDVHTGKTLWEQPVDHLDTLPSDKQKRAKTARATELKRYRDYMHWWNRMYYNNAENRLKTKDEREADFPALQKQAATAGWHFENAGYASGVKGVRDRMGLKLGDNKRGGMTTDKALIANANLVNKNRWHIRQGWTTEQPYYGSTHGSVVSDGTTIYAVTGIGGVAAYDLNGARRWVQWIDPKRSIRSGSHGNISSPVLVGATLVYFQRDSATMYGFDTATGKLRFMTESPKGEPGGDFKKGKPLNYFGHIGPGSTPVVLALGDEAVAVAGNGMVVRVSDGKMLGVVDGSIHSYFDMAGAGDVYYTTFRPAEKKGDIRIGAVRLGINDDTLTQERLWSSSDPIGNWEGGGNLAIDGNRLYAKLRGDKGGNTGMCILDAATGKVLAKQGPASEYYAVGDDMLITKSSGRKETRYRSLEVADKRTLKTLGKGLLVEPPAEGDVCDRHIAFLGWPEIWTGYGKVSAWGNRIFIRTNDYLWCIGDPKQPFQTPTITR